MATPTKEGTIPFDAPGANIPCHTAYSIYGPLPSASTSVPLVVLHGGPGCAHEYLLPLTDLAGGPKARPVVFYDQLGCGRSTRLRDRRGDTDFWTEELFRLELDNLLDKLDLKAHGFDLIGHSWGGMLGSAYATYKPQGLRRLVLSNSPASIPLWIEAANKLKARFPADVQAAVEEGERSGNFDSKEYQHAMHAFYRQHVCRVEPYPAPELKATEKALEDDSTVYNTMNGPTEFTITGSLKTWSVIERLGLIEVPTLLLNGQYDEAQESCVEPFFQHIPKVRWVTIQDASHMAYVEQREKYMDFVKGFLTQGK